MGQSRLLPEVMADVLTQEGAVLEKRNDGSLEFLIPSSLSDTLGVPEHGIFSFSHHSSCEGATAVSYDSEVFKAIERVFAGKGKMTGATYPSHLPNIDKLSKWALEKVVLSNATFRLQKVEYQLVTYMLVFFKYVALSDEKREGVFSLLVNKRNFSTFLLGDNSADLLVDLKEPEQVAIANAQETLKAIQAGFSAASLVVKEESVAFIKSLERRLNREIRRIFEYYETLKVETQRAFERKGLPGKDSGEGLTTPDEVRRILSGKLDTIEGEKRWKIQDLVSKYALNVRIEPICAIDIEIQTPVLWMDIKRRLWSRPFPLTYNPFFRTMDSLPCEACFYPRGGYFVCDEKLHILCASCFLKCPECGKAYCPLCYRSGCPRCNKKRS
ncbi:MAG: hypothetical protein A2156_12200 [Deltaproteobacteria bacterium RBG_16_48_10]|nr:MAG: hypothetical protein A2156_12200 [Deltaproteobacteria bacterium RBG_16_48_10]